MPTLPQFRARQTTEEAKKTTKKLALTPRPQASFPATGIQCAG